MVKWLKKYFIPHEHNNHKPHLLRWEATVVILGLVLLVETIFLFQITILSKTKFFADILSNVIVNETNKNRLAFNVNGLKENSLLDQAAQMKADDMAQKGYFSHNTPEEYTP
ncbi:hypothetical protein HY227_02430, partial [Candidatus Wolfebacteria bacterium]|nr:hypothetical protein [Candidatus Wolfebacteria bacterium]